MYQSYLYFEANTCLQEMAHWRRCAVRTTHAKINWASEASPTLGYSIEISRDIYIAYYTSKSGIWLVIS